MQPSLVFCRYNKKVWSAQSGYAHDGSLIYSYLELIYSHIGTRRKFDKKIFSPICTI